MKFLIPIIVGATIGYSTNWLAIKMLFRPYYAKKIFGIKLPFTPGLIPKESKRIAKSIGESIALYLITPETIIKAIQSDRIDENIRSSIEFSINKIKGSKNTIIGLLDLLDLEYHPKLSRFIETKLSKFIIMKLKEEKFEESLKIGINTIIRKEIQNLARDDRRIGEILPPVFIRRIKENVIGNKNDITGALKDILKNPSVKVKLKKAIINIIEENVPKLITAFISLERISDKVYSAIDTQLDNANTSDDIVYAINKVIDKMIDSSVSDLSKMVDRSITDEDIERISQSILDNIYLEKDNGSYIKMLEDRLTLIIHNMIWEWSNKPLCDLMKNLEAQSMEDIIRFLKTLLQKVAIDKLPSIVESLNISKIVEDQINSFDVSYVEDIILEISSKELKAITWLGALLGGILGVLSPLLQNL